MTNKFNYTTVDFDDVKNVTAAEYFAGEKFAADMFNAKYCHKTDQGLETPAEVFMRVAKGLAAMEDLDDNKEIYKNLWFSLMWEGWFRPGGSVLAGVGNKKKTSLLNCTTIPLEADSLDSIADCEKDMMKCAAYRQGLGVDVSRLRPNGAPVNNAAEASTGAVPWASKLSDIGRFVGQKGRMPAVLLSISVDHPDVREFIVAKTELGKIESANISVQVSNAFMDAVKNNTPWQLKFEFPDKKYADVVKEVSAKDLFDLICKTAYASAEPGVQYIDLMRSGSMVQQVFEATGDRRFELRSTNACSEKILPAYGSCNLSSINMEMFSTNIEALKDELSFVVPLVVRLSDNVVTYEINNNLSPLAKQKEILGLTREIGCGITNLHGWLLNADIPYDSDEAIKRTEGFMKYYAFNVFKSSMALGQEKGSAEAFTMVKDKSYFMKSIYFKNVVNEFFDGEFSDIVHMRNMAHMSIAPTGSLSNTFPRPCISSGIEPVIGIAYWRKTRAIDKGVYTYYFIIPNRLKDYLLTQLDSGSEDYKALASFSGSELDPDGIIGNKLIAIIDRTLPPGFFKPAHLIDPEKKIKLMAGAYKWIDACVSCTYNLPNTATAQDVANIYMKAYDHGVRAVSIYVDGSREGILIFEDPKTNAKKQEGVKMHICEERPATIMPNCAPKRPIELKCDIHHTSVKGEWYLVMVGLLDNQPFEVFAGPSEDLYIPRSCTEGKIIKQGGGKYALEVMIRKSPVVYKDLASVLMSDDERAVTRLISISLRHGVPPRYIVEQLKKSNGNITAFSTAISRVLARCIGAYTLDEKSICPSCGKASLMFTEGCIKCSDPECTYSRCG